VKPVAIDLFCGLGGWTEGLLAEGWHVIGIDIERHEYGEHRYPGELVLMDVLQVHGAWFKDVDLIVASPPCQAYSYMAMPWSRAKAKAAAIRADTTGQALADLTRLFDSCFRIQREACEAAGRHIPMVVENVRGAQPWVGKAVAHYGSFYLWGDVPELPKPEKAVKVPSFRFDGSGGSFQSASVRRTDIGKSARFTSRDCGLEAAGIKQRGDWFAEARKGGAGGTSASFGSKSPQRKFASAMIAKIPLDLSRHIAAHFKPRARSPAADASPFRSPAPAAPAGDPPSAA
jgi:C-5 cytosine-specific DNA methylase